MEQLLICMSLSLIAGLLASRAAKAVRLPAVTSYLVAGLLLGPFFLGRLGLSGWGFGFGSLAQVESYGIITQVALGFIAFVIGNEFRLSALESMGRQAVTVGILQAVITTVLVDIALVALHFARPDVISMASAITLGAIASATAPAATLMVVKQYKASGPLTRLLLMVVAIDDAVGLVLFSASFGIANALEQGRIDPISILLEPLVEIVLSLGLGALAGLLLNQLEIYFHSRSKRMSLSVAFVLLAVGLSMVSFKVGPIHCSFSLLLVCMMTGTVFCNICPTSDELMDRLDRWVSPVNILFFVLSGAELEFNRPGREFLLKTALSKVEDQYDYIIIDTPPALSLLTVNAYVATDSLIIPMSPEILSLLGVSQIKETIESVRSYYNSRLRVLGILLNKFSARLTLNREVLEMAEQIAAQLDTRVFQSKIRGSVSVAESPAHGVSVLDYAPRSKPSLDFEALCEEIAGGFIPHGGRRTDGEVR